MCFHVEAQPGAPKLHVPYERAIEPAPCPVISMALQPLYHWLLSASLYESIGWIGCGYRPRVQLPASYCTLTLERGEGLCPQSMLSCKLQRSLGFLLILKAGVECFWCHKDQRLGSGSGEPPSLRYSMVLKVWSLTSSIDHTWELITNEDSWAPPETSQITHLGGVQQPVFNKPSR